ncbi:integrase catalytic domain-containing protein [Trichonephila clavipes]|nr:integrase catalytic domain-containing protein [Trichonephila clavipes]
MDSPTRPSQHMELSLVYCKSITSDRKMLVHLIASKSRVAPTKQTTITRLELCTAVLIATIQEMTSSEQWRYVATEDNPADFVSIGMDSLKLKTCELWWNGPKFLMSKQYPQRQIPVAVTKDPGRSITSTVEPDLTNLNDWIVEG